MDQPCPAPYLKLMTMKPLIMPRRALLAGLALAGCAEARAPMGPVVTRPALRDDALVMADGLRLPLHAWQPEGPPRAVMLALHGMNEYGRSFAEDAAPWFTNAGVALYAYDQRGFGRSPNKGFWPEEELMREDLRTAVDVARKRHPDAVITVVGISMGASVAMTAFGSDDPPKADRLILSGPGLRGWGAINPLYRVSLYASAHINPGWIVVPPAGLIKIEPSDNNAMLRRTWSDPHMTYENRIDAVYGLVNLMENANDAAARLPAALPTLVSYGAKDIVIPENGVRRVAKLLPPTVRTVYYLNGYHMLERDLQAEKVHADYLAFMKAPSEALPSGESEWPSR